MGCGRLTNVECSLGWSCSSHLCVCVCMCVLLCLVLDNAGTNAHAHVHSQRECVQLCQCAVSHGKGVKLPLLLRCVTDSVVLCGCLPHSVTLLLLLRAVPVLWRLCVPRLLPAQRHLPATALPLCLDPALRQCRNPQPVHAVHALGNPALACLVLTSCFPFSPSLGFDSSTAPTCTTFYVAASSLLPPLCCRGGATSLGCTTTFEARRSSSYTSSLTS